MQAAPDSFRSTCYVFVYLDGQVQAVPAGILTIEGGTGREIASTFVYGDLYRERPNAISLDPLELPLAQRSGVVYRPRNGNALFGIFRDAAPDAWGRLVINELYLRDLSQRSRPQADAGQALPLPSMFEMPEMEYLLRSRNDRVGALDFRESPRAPEPNPRVSQVLHLDALLREAHRISLNERASHQIMTLLHPATGMGGARPKVTLEHEGRLWLAKFPIDNEALPITRVEAAMLDLASRCDIRSSEFQLVEVEGVRDPVLLVARFDRSCQGPGETWQRPRRWGYASALTLLGLDEFNMTAGSYAALAQVLLERGRAQTQARDRRELFRRMCLNVLVNNDDDHLRNHGFLVGAGAQLELTPAFDIVPRVVAPGITSTRRQAIAVGSFGREGTLDNLLSHVAPFGLDVKEARDVLYDVAVVVRDHWRTCLERAGVSPALVQGYSQTFELAGQMVQDIEERIAMEQSEASIGDVHQGRPQG